MKNDKAIELDLLNKTELKIVNIALESANLTDIATIVATELGLKSDDVLVVDYYENALTLDILNTCVNVHNIVGKQKKMLTSLGAIPGVAISSKTQIKSNGMLGWIALDESSAREALKKSEQIASEIQQKIAKRGIVFSSGAEVANKMIVDTNMPTIIKRLEAEGYSMTPGEILKDDKLHIAAKIKQACEYGGYGVIITTGGVGAESKDHTVEAIKFLDTEAATPYICHFAIGTGRHVKDGIKIAIGKLEDTLIIALPGPNDEVKASLNTIVEGLKQKTDKVELAEKIAQNLRTILRSKMSHHH